MSAKFSAWAKSQGIAYLTAYRWFRSGQMPVPCYQTPGGTIIVDVEGTAIGVPAVRRAAPDGRVALYARVSGGDQREDLDRQMARLRRFARDRGLEVEREVAETGSGLNGRRKKLLGLLADPGTGTIVVEHRGRLMRFGADYVEAALRASGRRLLVVDPEETRDDLVRDVVDVLTSLCARLYGRRSAKRRALAGVAAAQAAPGRAA